MNLPHEISLGEVSEVLGITERQVLKLVEADKLEIVSLGAVPHFRTAQVLELKKENE